MRGFLTPLVFVSIVLCASVACAQDWQDLNGEHFIVKFIQDERFAKDALDKAEVYYRRIAIDLGYPRYSSFWLWENRTKIYIYPDHSSYLKATGQPEWSHGMAEYTQKFVASYNGSGEFLDSILPHEIAHLIFRDFVGFKGEIPLWLDEGVAQWSEEKRRPQVNAAVKELYIKDSLLTIKDLTELDLRYFKQKNRIYIRATHTREGARGVLFLDTVSLVNTYYLQAFSVVGFLITKYGSDRFADFCRELRGGKSLNDALKSSYALYVPNLDKLEKRWREYLEHEI
ncbi:hypothetical protein ACFL0P_03540 [Candidatus Omnitrophota bacterium]